MKSGRASHELLFEESVCCDVHSVVVSVVWK